MRKIYTLTIFALLLISNLSIAEDNKNSKSSPNQNKRNKVLSGQFKLETATKQKNPYETGLDASSAYLKGLQSTLTSNASGNANKVAEIDDDSLNFLTAAYLYCSVNNGVCQYFLDSLLEADVVNSRINKQDGCKTLRSFWKQYISNELEARHKYATKIGFLAETGDFNTKTRPKYIKCVDTVKNERVGTMSDSDFFKKRYADNNKIAAVTKTIEYIDDLKSKQINVFTEISNMR